MAKHDQRLKRIKSKIAAGSVRLSLPLAERRVAAFESKHRVVLPEGYRRFILEVGASGEGPPHYGLVRLGETPPHMYPEAKRNWTKLPHLDKPFPFRRTWCWEGEEHEDEAALQKERAGIYVGNIVLGDDGCGMYWHLIVTGSERSNVWQFTGEGIAPTDPKRDFLRWYEDWLDGVED